MSITKNTTIIFLDGKNKHVEELAGGIPLSKGEVVHVRDNTASHVLDYNVIEKNVDCFLQKNSATVNMTHTLKKK